MLSVIAVECEYQRRSNADAYRRVADLGVCAREVLGRALTMPDGRDRHMALLHAGGLCIASRERAYRDVADQPLQTDRLLNDIYAALDPYERIPADMRFETLYGSQEDRSRYNAIIVAAMNPEDVHTAETFFGLINEGSLIGWWLMRDEAPIGWCVLAPDHGKYVPRAYHLYGSWVAPVARRQGLARMMWLYRMHMVPRLTPITASIQNGKTASLRIAEKLGFRSLGSSGPWEHYVHDH